jgi:hypothetical protein
MQSGSDLARMASYEQHPTFPTRALDNAIYEDLHRIAGLSSGTGVRWPEDPPLLGLPRVSA